MNNGMKMNAQAGFTLIELIVVIVILGILAATALPKFANLSGDARVASLQAAKGSISSASAMLHGKWLIKNEATITVEGANIGMVLGYPDSASIAAAAGISNDDYKVTVNGQTTTVTAKNLTGAQEATCKVAYTEATAVRAAPLIVMTATDCG